MDDVTSVPLREGEVFVVELTQFSGPLDLLLSLIRDEQIDIQDIPVARIAEQFLARIKTLQLDEAADYLEMAARLVRIKALMLLPRPEGDEQWEDPRAERVRRLLEYQQVREVVDILERRSDDRRNRFARAFLPQNLSSPAPQAAALSLYGQCAPDAKSPDRCNPADYLSASQPHFPARSIHPFPQKIAERRCFEYGSCGPKNACAKSIRLRR